LSRLPDHYRGVIVLCDLEGMTRREAAGQLGIPEGSVASRLARARVMLAKRLTQRGVVFSGGSVVAVLSAGSASASAPPALVASTIKAASLLAAGKAAATGAISAKVAALTEGMVKAMLVTKIKGVLAVVLVVAALAGAAGLIYQTQAAEQPKAKEEQPAAKNDQPKNAKKEPPVKEKPAAEKPAEKIVTIRGKVVDDATGKPIAALIVQAGKFDPADPKKVTWGYKEDRFSAADGSFSTTIRWDEGWTARILADGYFPHPVISSAPPADKDEIEVTIRLKRVPDKVRGMVLDHKGNPVKDAAVFAVGPAGVNLAAGQAWLQIPEGRKDDRAPPVHTDEQGRFELPTGGAKTLAVSYTQFDAWPAAIPASGDVMIRLPEPARVEINLDIDGAEKESVIFYQLLSHHMSEEFTGLQSSRWVGIANPGKLVLATLPPGKYQLCRMSGTGAMLERQFFELKAGGTKSIRYVRKEGAKVRGKVTWPADAKLSGIVIRVVSEKSETYASLAPGEDGTFLTERVPPGTYQLLAYAYKPLTPEQMRNTSPIAPSYHAQVTIKVPASGELKAADLELKPIRSGKGEEKQPKGKEDKLRVLIDKVLAGHGGEDKLNKLKSFTMTVKHSNGTTVQYFVQLPDRYRAEYQLNGSKTKEIFILLSNRRAKELNVPFRENEEYEMGRWTKRPNEEAGQIFVPGLEPSYRDYVKFFGPRQVLTLKDANHRVTLLDEEIKVDGRAAVGVEVTGPQFNGHMYFDKEKHLLLKTDAVTYSDYKTFDGIPVAQKENDAYLMPQVTDFRAVDKLDAKLFEQP
jgi:hypothetical protein